MSTINIPTYVLSDFIQASRAMLDAANHFGLAHSPDAGEGVMSVEEAEHRLASAWIRLSAAEYYAQKALDASEVNP